ncbi:MAG: flippase [Patescibacteria group bacterium]|jgi:O-antigen/teichoic acid export membrane protein
MLDKIFSKIERFVPRRWRWILEHEGFKRYFANTGWLFGGQIFSLIISFFVGIWIARYLGPGNYGILNYALSFAGLFSLVAGFGIDGILTRDFVRHPEKTAEFFGTGSVIKFASGALAWALSTIAAFIFIPEFLPRLLVSLFSLSFIFQGFNIVDSFFRSRVEARYSVQAQVLAAVVASLLKILVIILGGGVIWLIAAYVIEILCVGIALRLIYLRRRFKFGPWRWNFVLAKQMLRLSWPLMLSGVSAFFLLKIDQVLLANFISESAVGLYAAGAKLTEVWYFIPGIICSSLFPAIVRARSGDQKLFKQRLRSLYLLLLFLAVIIAVPLSLLAKPLVFLMFGEAYRATGPIAAVYIWSIVGWFLSYAVWTRFIIENRSGLVFFASFLPLVLNVALNLWWIPIYGSIGSAWATVVAYSAGALFIFYKDDKNESPLNYN